MRNSPLHHHLERDQTPLWRFSHLVTLAAVLALILGAFTWYELTASRRAILGTMEQGAASLIAAVSQAGENAIRADAEMEILVINRLLDNARHIWELEHQGILSDLLLVGLAADNELFSIELFDESGKISASSRSGNSQQVEDIVTWDTILAPILQGNEDEIVLGFDADDLYAVAIRRPSQGAIVVRASAFLMLDLRRTAGTGRLIQEIGTNPDVAYMVLQDTIGILLASLDVKQLSRIKGDAFLEKVMTNTQPHSRQIQYRNKAIFETVMPFIVDSQPLGLWRIGLSLEDVEAEQARVTLQLILLAGLLLVIGAAGVGVVTIRQNYALLDQAYERIQTYSSRILGNMADAVMAMDLSGQIQVFNRTAEQLFGSTAHTALGQDYTTVLGTALKPIQTALSQHAEVQGQLCQCQLADGRELNLAVSISLIRDSESRVETVVVVMQDLTEKMALEADLRRRDRLASMGALASGVAHEVRNPLNAIALIVQRLEREFLPTVKEEDYRRLIGLVRGQIERVNRIVKDFLNLAKPAQLQPQIINLDALLEKIAQVMAPQAAIKKLRLEQKLGPCGQIEADPDQLEQALLNLVKNAIEATAEGTIYFQGQALESGVEIIVEDTGPGIPREDLERIFDLYFTTKAEGTGLGLSIVQRIISQHGGYTEVKSELGRGTRFSIFLNRTIIN